MAIGRMGDFEASGSFDASLDVGFGGGTFPEPQQGGSLQPLVAEATQFYAESDNGWRAEMRDAGLFGYYPPSPPAPIAPVYRPSPSPAPPPVQTTAPRASAMYASAPKSATAIPTWAMIAGGGVAAAAVLFFVLRKKKR